MDVVVERSRVSIAEADPDLLRDVDGDMEQITRVATAEVLQLQPGPWQPLSMSLPLYGLFVLNGMLSRGVVIQGRRSAELLGPGDILRPAASDDFAPSVSFSISWEVLVPTQIALLDIEFATAIAPWPQLTGALMDRIMRRAHALGVHLAVSHLKLVEMRLLVILWYYADRWGRVTPDGILLPLRLTHGMLARIVGARRPSVSTALGRLHERDLVHRTPSGEWLLIGEPPDDGADELPGEFAASNGG